MNIINSQTYFSNKQLRKIIKFLDSSYKPDCIIIYETRRDVLKNMFKYSEVFTSLISILLGKTEGLFWQPKNRVSVFVFSENDDGDDRESKQLYSFLKGLSFPMNSMARQCCILKLCFKFI